jgi:hypothetical protein
MRLDVESVIGLTSLNSQAISISARKVKEAGRRYPNLAGWRRSPVPGLILPATWRIYKDALVTARDRHMLPICVWGAARDPNRDAGGSQPRRRFRVFIGFAMIWWWARVPMPLGTALGGWLEKSGFRDDA